MAIISPFRSTTTALFKPLAKPDNADANAALKAAVQKAAALKAAELQAMALRARSGPATANIGQGSADGYKEPRFSKDLAADLAKAEAAMEKWEANEQQFAKDNGYRREVNSMLLGMYAHAKTGVFGTAAIATRKDMNDHLDRFISGFQSAVALINQSGGSLTVGAADQSAPPKGLDPAATAIAQAKAQDHLDAVRMTLYSEAVYVQKSLGLAHPLVTGQNGKVSFTEQTIAFQGKPFAQIGADGALTLLATNPDPNHPDPTDLYLPLNLLL